MATPRALILRAPGTNCDGEAAFAFERAGAVVERLHLNALQEQPTKLHRFQILVLPGGFSYGDDVAAGKIFASRLQSFADQLQEFRDSEKLILGICNGFQVLLKAGLILPPDDEGPVATLAHNDSGTFQDRWVELEVTPGKCPFLKGMTRMAVPIAHGEGKFVTRKEWMAKGLAKETDQAVLKYVVNPNGSQEDIAGVCDASGRVLGLMPHPERHVLPTQHPQWTRLGLKEEGEGMPVFRNAVEYFTK